MARRSAIFRNGQWEVTSFGLGSLRLNAPCRYQIDAEHLLQMEGELYGWPLHVIQKSWVDPRLFFEAFKVAIDMHYPGKVDLGLLSASFDGALRFAGRKRPGRSVVLTDRQSGKYRSRSLAAC